MSAPRPPACKYGAKCYRKNAEHFEQYSHPAGSSAGQSSDAPAGAAVSSQGGAAKRRRLSDGGGKQLRAITANAGSLPLFLTTVQGIDDRFNEASLSLRDILFQRDLFGKLVKSIHFNFMVELDWLLVQYPCVDRRKPLYIVVGVQHGTCAHELRADAAQLGVKDSVKVYGAVLPVPYGTHHTKMAIVHYETGVRIIIGTANLIEKDWRQKTQALFVTPLLPFADNEADSDCDTFKSDLLSYLRAYNSLADHLKPWIDLVGKLDCSELKCRLVATVPGYHKGESMHDWGHMRLRKLLSRSPAASAADRTLVCQASSIGSLGPSAHKWLVDQLGRSMCAARDAVAPITLIYPSVADVRASLEGYAGGGSLPYSKATDAKQHWLRAYMHRWRSERKGRTRALPHVKTYCSMCAAPAATGGGDDESETECEADWILVTSANMSRAAWGDAQKNGTQLFCRSYELGVLFVGQTKEERRRLANALPYDVDCLKKYRKCNAELPTFKDPKMTVTIAGQDTPWLADGVYKEPDCLGHVCNV